MCTNCKCQMATCVVPNRAYDDYVSKHGKHFSMNMANFAVSNLLNNDGSVGPHWTCDEVQTTMGKLGYAVPEECKYDAFYLANLAYSDHFGTSMMCITNCFAHVNDLINDRDGYEGAIFSTWLRRMIDTHTLVDFRKNM